MKLPQLMGIVNVTPDSFSGDGFARAEDALSHAASLLAQGADIVDVGAESTRPGATPITATQEWQRLSSVLPELVKRAHGAGKKISLDTRHAPSAARAIELGVDIINDVSGCTDEAMLRVLASSDCDVICMHSLTIPADKSVTLAEDADVLAELTVFAHKQAERMQAAGIDKSRMVFDPGIGFAKTSKQSFDVLRHMDKLSEACGRLLIGHSRKSFLSAVTDAPFADRDALTLAVSSYLVQHNVEIIRVHNIHLHRELLKMISILYA